MAAYGSVTSVYNYNKANGIKTPTKEPERPKSNVKPTEGAFIIADEEVTTVSQDELDLLDNIILKNNPHEVYMRRDIEAYDQLYFVDNNELSNELLKEVRGLRRIYRDYRQYLYACWLRDVYLDSLEDQFSSNDKTVMKYKEGRKIIRIPPGTFIPPVPIYSRHAADWDQVQKGTFSISNTVMMADEDAALEFMEKFRKELDIDVHDIGTTTGIQTDRRVMKVEVDDDELAESQYSGPNSVNVSDLDSMQKYMRYWFKKDEAEKEETREKVPFPKSQEGMRRLTEMAIGMQILEGYANRNSKEDGNQMIYDEVLKKSMTLSEYNKRTSLRTVCEYGGWDIVKIMQQLNIGSKYERKIAQKKNRRSNKVRKQARDFFRTFEGENVTDVEELRDYFFGQNGGE